jgi:hypothetical protein
MRLEKKQQLKQKRAERQKAAEEAKVKAHEEQMRLLCADSELSPNRSSKTYKSFMRRLTKNGLNPTKLPQQQAADSTTVKAAGVNLAKMFRKVQVPAAAASAPAVVRKSLDMAKGATDGPHTPTWQVKVQRVWQQATQALLRPACLTPAVAAL